MNPPTYFEGLQQTLIELQVCSNSQLIALVVVGCLTLVLGIVTIRGAVFWWKEGEKLRKEPGHATPPSPLLARITRVIVARLFRRFFVGPVTVLGQKNLNYEGRLIILINHQTERDAIMVPSILGLRHTRALMAVTQIHGIRTPLAAWSGIIAVHHDTNPMAAVRAAIKILQGEKDSSFVVFPQGALIRDNHLKREEFFDGAMMIAKMVAQKSEQPLAVLPAAIAYDRNPAHGTLLHRFFDMLGLFKYRNFFGESVYRGGIAFGEPIPMDALPTNRKEAMDIAFEQIVALSASIHEKLDIPTNPVTA